MNERLQQFLIGLRNWQLLLLVVILFSLPRIVSHFNPGPWRWTHSNADVMMYYHNATLIVEGKIPYRDFVFEYPPLATVVEFVPLTISRIFSSSADAYVFVFTLFMSVVSVTTLRQTEKLAAYLGVGNAIHIRLSFIVILGIMSVIAPFRLDMLCALLVISSLRFLLYARSYAAGAVVAAGILLKLFPLIFLPLMLLYSTLQRGLRDAIRLLMSVTLIVLFVLTLSYSISGPSLQTFLTFHAQRSLQVESVAGAALLLVHPESAQHLQYVFGADHIMTAEAQSIANTLPFVTIVLIVGVTIWAWYQFSPQRNSDSRARLLVDFVMLLMLCFICSSKVYSPQYLLWLMPLICVTQSRSVRWLFPLLSVLSIANLLVGTPGLLQGNIIAILFVNLRNILSLVLLGLVGNSLRARSAS